MKYLLTAFFCFFLAGASNVFAQSKSDEEAVTKLPQEFCDAWAQHDGHALAKIMADDVDFVTVATTYLHGREDFETFHVRLLSGRFKDSTITVLKTTTRFLRPDMAVVHWSWKIEGDKNPDGTARAAVWVDDVSRGKEERKLARRGGPEHQCNPRRAARTSRHQDAYRDSRNQSG